MVFDHLLDFFKDKKHPISDSIYFNKYIFNNDFVCDAPSARKNIPDTASNGLAVHSVNLAIFPAGVAKKRKVPHISIVIVSQIKFLFSLFGFIRYVLQSREPELEVLQLNWLPELEP